MTNSKRNQRYSKHNSNNYSSQERALKKSKKEGKKKQDNAGFSTLSQVAGLPKRKEHHSNIPVNEPKIINEPVPSCQICKEPIQNICQSIMTPEGNSVHFDCVLSVLNDQYSPKENQKISYIGSGKFGLCEKNEEGKWSIIETIQYESNETHRKMIEYVESLRID